MEIARFTYKEGRTKALHGIITVNSDGNISISIANTWEYSLEQKTAAKALAGKIIQADFKHEAVTWFHEDDSGLLHLLKEHTVDIKEKLLEHKRTFIKDYFTNAERRMKDPWESWYDEFEIRYTHRNDPNNPNKKIIHPTVYSPFYWEMMRAYDIMKQIVEQGFDKFEQEEIQRTEQHFDKNLIKLSDKLRKRGVVSNQVISVEKTWVDQKLIIIIQQNNITAKVLISPAGAYKQKHHYRFLVK